MTNKPEFRNIPLENLKTDSSNPRLPKSFHGKSDLEIINYLLLESSLVELMQAIGENDFFPGEQLLVVKNAKGDFTVIEGNRRLTAVRLLNAPELAEVQTKKVKKVFAQAKFKPKELPCLVFNDRSEIIKYLGYRHITGIQTWKLLEKARYLYELKEELFPSDDLNDVSREIAKMIGSRMDYVRRLLVGFDLYKFIEDNGFYKIPNLNDTTFHFNYIADSLNHANISRFLGVDFKEKLPTKKQKANHIEEWTHWFFEKNKQNQTRLKGTSGDLTKLNKILGDSKAFSKFREGYSLVKAYQLTDDLNILFYNSIQKSLDNLEQADAVVHRVNNFIDGSNEDLRSIMKLARKIKNTIEDLQDDLD